MPNISLSVEQSNHDGHATWANRSSINGTDFTTTILSPLGCHLNDTHVMSRFFIFRFGNGSVNSGIPQGTTINSAKLELRFNNGALAGGVHSHTYICVENNLDPTGTGAIVNGTGNLGSQAWQRLGRQAAAVTRFGARCGPTHTGNLATVGRGVRDSQALVYRAFGEGRAITTGTWHQTDDFAGALQALVNDPDWNSDSQYVMVHMFSDHRISAGSTGGVGYLGGITWASGQSGVVGEGNAPGTQIFFKDHTTNDYAPRLLIDYTSTSLKAMSTGSVSSGAVRLRPALCLGRLMGERVEMNAGGAITPKMSAGAHDLPFTGMQAFNSSDLIGWNGGNAPGSRIKWGSPRPGRSDGRRLLLEDWIVGDNNIKAPKIWWDVNGYQDEYTSVKTYSMRFYYKNKLGAFPDVFPAFAKFMHNGVEKFRIEHKEVILDLIDINNSTYNEVGIRWSGGHSPWTTYKFVEPSGDNFYRFELQVDASTNPKVRLRGYWNDSTVPLDTVEANPPDVEIDQIIIGDFHTGTVLYSMDLADIEIWSDYNLNRQFPDDINNTVGTPYKPKPWAWFEYDGEEIINLEDLGPVASISPSGNSVVLADPPGALTLEDYNIAVWPGDTSAYTLHQNLSYGPGFWRRLDLYVPRGTPPPGGWPVIIYTHGGFWIAGNKGLINKDFVTHCCLRGYAVASCDYVKSGLYLAALNQSYPTWNPSEATGRYPTFTLNFKEAAHWLKTRSSVATGGNGTYNLNANKLIATGHSAGGYNAASAVASRGLTNDGSGRNLTLAGNVSTYGCPNVPDPVFLGGYIFAGPVSLDDLQATDPTVPDWPYLNNDGIMKVTARMFRAQRADVGSGDTTNCGIDTMVRANAPRVASICYVWSPHDFLVVSHPFNPKPQVKTLEDAFKAVAGSLPPTTKFESHKVPDSLHHTIQDVDMDYQHFFRWLKQLPGI